MRRVIIVSDCTDVAFLELCLAIEKSASAISPGVDIRIGPLVPAQKFSEINAAFLMRLVAELAPPGTLIMCVANSLQERTERLVGRTVRGDLVFVGANTGTMGWLTQDFGVEECFQIEDPGFVPFGGKAVHAPVVGAVAAGKPLASAGSPFPPDSVRRTPVAEGDIVHIDNFGNAKFPFRAHDLCHGDRLRVDVGGRRLEAVYGTRMMDEEDGTWVVYPGSSLGLHELGQVRARGLLDLSCGVGHRLRIRRAVPESVCAGDQSKRERRGG
ncbi:SAM-dependent chlorinase/fluorinase [Streptomyces sp. 110]|uniref:SAM-dependent chlorinase/fluorinase n=1 Tax=Streptomyces endocoffeicus TaxID=2898945 RepID=A0ABS1PRC9_9ACTN|nr:SAM-dependent chlorinase/fluorinase [Streptomyces endocoffeicus]MBL1114976.1 SAM-dependent chlorinase/fluorinase [Streptomyces endocoffeicus]